MENMSFVFRCFFTCIVHHFSDGFRLAGGLPGPPFLRHEMHEMSCLFFVKNGEGNGAISIWSFATD